MSNIRFQNALKGIVQDVPPIWFMRQAGRYHKHYQRLREQHGFIELCKQPELAAEVTLGPIEDFDFDVAILFSDLLFPLQGLGMGLDYVPGPHLDWQLNADNLSRLGDVEQALGLLEFQAEAMRLTREQLPKDKSLIGFVGGPWTLFCYAVLGGHDGNLIAAKRDPDLYRYFCDKMVPLLIGNIQLQLDAGAEVVMIFDTSAGYLEPTFYTQQIVPTIKVLAEKFPGRLGYYAKNTTDDHYQSDFFRLGLLAGQGFDHRFDLTKMMAERDHHNISAGKKLGFVQGNFDQALLFQSPEVFQSTLEEYTSRWLQLTTAQRAGWVCGLGHGVLPQTPEENVRTFVTHVRKVFSS